MSTIFAIASGNASRGISSCGRCQRIGGGHSKKGAAPRGGTRPLSSLDVGREKDYLQCEGVLRSACGWDARSMGWERRPPRGLLETILSPRHRDLRDTIREGEKERRNMIRRKTAVAVLIAVIVGAAFAAYTFRPKATTSSVAVNEPGTDTGNPGTGTTPSTPPTSPAKASQGPKHDKCVHENDHITDQARAHAANASDRWAAAHARTTESPPTGTRPTRWTIDISRAPNFSFARSTSSVRVRNAIGL